LSRSKKSVKKLNHVSLAQPVLLCVDSTWREVVQCNLLLPLFIETDPRNEYHYRTFAFTHAISAERPTAPKPQIATCVKNAIIISSIKIITNFKSYFY